MKMKKGIKKVKTEKKERKAKRAERISTGIYGFDSLIEGGFEKNSVNLTLGGSGSGKTIFAVQFLVEGIKRGESVLYITFEEKREEFFRNMLDFGWDLNKYEKEGKFVFLEYSPEKVRVMLEEGGGAIESIVLKQKISRIVIDSISSFALLFDKELERREAALSLFDIIRKWNCTSLLTLEEEPDSKHGNSSSSLEFEVDGIILLYFVRYKNKRQRFIEVLKLRGTKHSTEIHPFDIGKSGVTIGKGIFKDHLVE